MTNEITVLLNHKIDLIEHGQEIGLKDMFGIDWDLIGSSGDKKIFGKEVKSGVLNGTIIGLRHIGVTNNGRNDIYCKI
jgi:hypothetical protein